MVGQTQWHTEPQFLSDPMSDRKKKFSPTLRNIYKKQHGARPCAEKMQLIFFVPPNEELEGTLLPKNEGKRVHVPPDEKTCGHAGYSIWLPGPIICSDWLKFQRSSSLKLMN